MDTQAPVCPAQPDYDARLAPYAEVLEAAGFELDGERPYGYPGVGRGMGAGVTKAQGADYARLRNKRGQLHHHERRAKRWYSRQIGRETHRLSELVSELWGTVGLATAAAALPAESVVVFF